MGCEMEISDMLIYLVDSTKTKVSNDDVNRRMQARLITRLSYGGALMQVSNPVESGERDHGSELVDHEYAA